MFCYNFEKSFKEIVLKKIVVYCFVALVLFLQGCATNSSPTKQEPSTQNVAQQSADNGPKLTQMVGRNYIKGVVLHLTYDSKTQLWTYDIDGIETTNGKLPRVVFTHRSVLANEGDLVYASFDGMRLNELFVMKPGFYKNGKIAPSAPTTYSKPKSSSSSSSSSAPTKRDKAHQVVGVPEEETIKLN